MEPFNNDMLKIEEVSKVMALSWFVLKLPEVSVLHKGTIKDSPAAKVVKTVSSLRVLNLVDMSVISDGTTSVPVGADRTSGSSLDIHEL